MTYKPKRAYTPTAEDEALVAKFEVAIRQDFTYLESILKAYHRVMCKCGNPKNYNRATCTECSR